MVATGSSRPTTSPVLHSRSGGRDTRIGSGRLRAIGVHVNRLYVQNRPLRVPAFPSPDEPADAKLQWYAQAVGITPGKEGDLHSPIVIPRTFSLLDNPTPVLGTAEEIVARGLSPAEQLLLDSRHCAQTDLCGEALCYALARAAYNSGKGVNGEEPEIPLARGVIPAWGAPAVFPISVAGTHGDELLLPLTEEFCPAGLTDEERSARVNAHVEKVLSRLSRQFEAHTLEKGLADRLSSCLAEIAANAIQHGGGGWLAAASYRRLDQGCHGRFQIVMFNFGETLAETLKETDEPLLRSECEALLDHHRLANYFDDPNWTPEAFWTIAALQDAVSRLGTPRGSGSYTILELMQYAAENSRADFAPRMCIMSGHVHVLVDGRFKQSKSSGKSRANKYDIAFNFPNDLRRPPNPSAVSVLPRFFPGVLVTLQLYITEDHLQQTRGDYGNVDDPALGKVGRRDY